MPLKFSAELDARSPKKTSLLGAGTLSPLIPLLLQEKGERNQTSGDTPVTPAGGIAPCTPKWGATVTPRVSETGH